MSRPVHNSFSLRALVKQTPTTRRPLRLETLEPRLVMYALAGNHWSNPNVSVSFLPDGTSSEGYLSNLFAELDAVAPRDVWQREFARALQTWANVSTLNFHFVADSGSPTGTSGSSQGDSRFGDIRLGAHPLTNGYVGYAYYPSSTTKGGDITLSPDVTFHVGTYLDLFSTLLHEVGHAIGLAHGTSGTIMYPTIMAVYTGLTADDIAGVQAIYGSRQHDSYDAAAANNSLAAATSLVVGASGGVSLLADLTTMEDVDYYRVVAPTGSDGTLTVTLDARGRSFLAPKLLVYDAQGNLVATADAGSAYGTVATAQLSGLFAGQTYTLVADGSTADAFGMGAYQLVVQFGVQTEPPPLPPPPPTPPPPPSIAADRFEANNGFNSATNLGKFNSQTQTGLTTHSTTDADWFRFSVSKSGTFNISVLFASAGGTLDVTIYDAQQNVLAVGASTADNETVQLSLSAGNQYYVRVASPTGALNTYDLAISKIANSPGGRSAGGLALDVGHGTPAIGGDHHDHDGFDDDVDLGWLVGDVGRVGRVTDRAGFAANAVPITLIGQRSNKATALWLDDLALDRAASVPKATTRWLGSARNLAKGHFTGHIAPSAVDPVILGELVLLS